MFNLFRRYDQQTEDRFLRQFALEQAVAYYGGKAAAASAATPEGLTHTAETFYTYLVSR